MSFVADGPMRIDASGAGRAGLAFPCLAILGATWLFRAMVSLSEASGMVRIQ